MGIYDEADRRAAQRRGSPDAARRLEQRNESANTGPVEAVDQYKGNWAAETTRSVLSRAASDFRNAPEVIGRYAFGDTDGAQRAARRWQGETEKAKALGPEVQDFSQVDSVGSGLSAAGYQIANMVPDMAASIVGGGVVGGLARRQAKKAAVGSVVGDLMKRDVAEVALKQTAARDAARQAAVSAGSTEAGVSNAVRVAGAEATEAAKKGAMAEAVAIAGRTPLIQANIDRVATRGFREGVTLGGIPGLSGQNVERYADEETTSADAAKLLVGTTAASALQALPLERLGSRFGSKAAAEIAQQGERFVPRVSKEFVQQGLAEGAEEGSQQAIQLASQRWMDGNYEAPTGEEYKSVMQSAAAGFLLGGLMGSGAEVGRSGAVGLQKAAKAGWDVTSTGYKAARDMAKERLRVFGDAARTARANNEKKYAAGQPMGEETSPGSVSAASIFGRVGEAVKSGVKGASDIAGKATDKFTANLRSVFDNDNIDNDVDEVFNSSFNKPEDDAFHNANKRHEAFIGTGQVEGFEADRYTNPVQMPTRLQDLLMRNIPADSPMWQWPEAAAEVGTALEKAVKGEPLEDRHHELIEAMTANPAAGMDAPTLKKLVVLGPQIIEALQKSEDASAQFDAPEGADAPEAGAPESLNTQMSDAMGLARQEADAADSQVNSPDAELDFTADAEGTLGSQLETDEYGGGVTTRPSLGEPTEMDTFTGLVSARSAVEARLEAAKEGFRIAPDGTRKPLDPAVAEGAVREAEREFVDTAQKHNYLKSKLRNDILSDTNSVWTRNEASKDKYDAKLQSPGTVRAVKPLQTRRVAKFDGDGVGDAEGTPAKKGQRVFEPQLLELSTLTYQQMARMREAGFADTEGNVPGAQALFEAVANLELLGIKVDPSTFSLGQIQLENGTVLATITDKTTRLNDNEVNIDTLRGMVSGVGKGTRFNRAKKEGNKEARAAAVEHSRKNPIGTKAQLDEAKKAVKQRLASKAKQADFNAAVVNDLRDKLAELRAARIKKDPKNLKPTAAELEIEEEILGFEDQQRDAEGVAKSKPGNSYNASMNREDLEVRNNPDAIAKDRADAGQEEDARLLVARDTPRGTIVPGNKKERGYIVSVYAPTVTDVNFSTPYESIIDKVRSMKPEGDDTAILEWRETRDEISHRVDVARVSLQTEIDKQGSSKKGSKAYEKNAASIDAINALLASLAAWRKRIGPQPSYTGATKEDMYNARFRAGIQIGKAELAKERAAGMSEVRYNKALRELRDPDSGAAAGYWNKAVKGEFDSAKVSNAAVDQETVAKGKGNDREEMYKYYPRDKKLKQLMSAEEGAGENARKKEARKRQAKAPARLGKALSTSDPSLQEIAKRAARDKVAADKVLAEVPAKEAARKVKVAAIKAEVTARLAEQAAKDTEQAAKRAVQDKRDADTRARSKAKRNKLLDSLGAVKAPFENSISDVADGEPGTHDYGKETSLANALLEAMGFDYRVKVQEDTRDKSKGHGGGHAAVLGVILLGNKLEGGERAEVFAHEIGHAVIAAHLSKVTGVPVSELQDANGALRGDAWMDALETADPKLFKALEADYNKWVLGVDKNASQVSVRATTSGLHRAAASEVRTEKVAIKDLPKEKRDYLLSMNEWMADNISRALVQGKTSQGIIGKFFSDIAKMLTDVYDSLFGTPEGKAWAPAPSVDAWVKSLFDENVGAVKAAIDVAVPAAAAESIVRAAAQEQAIPSPRVALPTGDPAKLAQQAAKNKAAGRPAAAPLPANGERYSVSNFNDLLEFIKYTLPPAERALLERAFSRGTAMTQLREYWAEKFPDATSKLDDAKVGAEHRVALGYIAWRNGAFNVGPQTESALLDSFDNLMSIFGMAANGDIALRVLNDIASGVVDERIKRNLGYDVRKLEAQAKGQRQAVLNWISTEGPISSAMAKFWTSQYARIRDSGVPALRQIVSALQRPQGTTGDDDRGYNPAVRLEMSRFHNKFRDAMAGLEYPDQVLMLKVLQRQATKGAAIYDEAPAPVKKAVKSMRALMAEAYSYASDEEVGMFSEGKQNRPNYFPVQMSLVDEDMAQRLHTIYSKPEYREALFEQFKIPKKERNAATAVRLAQRMVDGAVGADRSQNQYIGSQTLDGISPDKRRFSQMIYDVGNADDIRAFEEMQTKNPDEVFARYFSPMVKAAEFRRRFGQWEYEQDDQGNETRTFEARAKLDLMLKDAKRQGATPEQLELAENSVKAALGTYGTDGSPTLAAFSPALAATFGGPKTKSFVQGTQAYQNLRLLPLALISSLVDPMGIAVRTGGNFTEAWHGMRTGIRAITNKTDAAAMLALLEEVGLADDFMPALASHPVFDGEENAFARRINEGVFKWNGMNTWIMATRVMALHAAHKFLMTHAAKYDTDDTSRRYLDELSIKPSDIVADEKDPNKVALNDKTSAALRQFVDEAILRPNSTQVPLWHRDPYMGLVTQYKAFGYAIYDQITSRIAREWNHGNFRVGLAALAYLPIVLMAELLREFLQYAGSGNPNRKDWGPDDYALLAVERTGMISPQATAVGDAIGDVKRDRIPGTSQLGPTGGQASNVLDALRGRRDRGKEFEAALPGSAAWRHLNDDAVTTPEDGMARRSAA